MSLLPRLLLLLVGLLGVIYLATCGLLWWRQTRMIFLPSPYLENTPASLGLPYEEVWLALAKPTEAEVEPGLPIAPETDCLHGWWITAQGSEQSVLLYLHGNGINIGANLDHAARFQQLGIPVLLMDYRGYGRSRGAFPTEQQVYQDAEAMWSYLVQERQISPDRIFVYGHSLGGAIAIELATRHPQIAGLIIDGSFTSMGDMVELMPSLRFFPSNWLLHQRFNSIEKIATLQMPILLIHGTADTRVPATMSQALYAAASEPKQLYLVPQAGHNNVAETAGPEYMQIVWQFMKQSLKQKRDYIRNIS